jgi:hypothetical protein
MLVWITNLARSVSVKIILYHIVASIFDAFSSGVIWMSVIITGYATCSRFIEHLTTCAINWDTSSVVVIRDGLRKACLTGSVDV